MTAAPLTKAAIDALLDAAIAHARDLGMIGKGEPPSGIEYARVGDRIEVDVSVYADGIEYSDRALLGTVIIEHTRGER